MVASCFVARLRACCMSATMRTKLAHGEYAITGGLGGLGLRAAKMIVETLTSNMTEEEMRDMPALPGTAPGDLVSGFFSEQNWGFQAVTLLGSDSTVPVAGLGFVAVWVLLILRFTIFYGFFGEADL